MRTIRFFRVEWSASGACAVVGVRVSLHEPRP